DGVRADVNGNLWCSSNAGRAVGYSGVTVWTPEGKLIGRIRLPEVCANVCFGGPKRNRLFMAASQSLYAVYLRTQGAAPGQAPAHADRTPNDPPLPVRGCGAGVRRTLGAPGSGEPEWLPRKVSSRAPGPELYAAARREPARG